MDIGYRIRELRKKRGFTLNDVAQKAGMQASNLSDIEKGKRDIRTQTLERIAHALRCSPSELIDFEYEYDEEIAPGLRELIDDKKTCMLMNITEDELKWMRSIKFRPNQSPMKNDFIDLLFIYRNIES